MAVARSRRCILERQWRRSDREFWYKQRVAKGDTITLATPAGERQFAILGVFADFQGAGDLGGIAISRPAYRSIWGDSVVSRIRVWTVPGADPKAFDAAAQGAKAGCPISRLLKAAEITLSARLE